MGLKIFGLASLGFDIGVLCCLWIVHMLDQPIKKKIKVSLFILNFIIILVIAINILGNNMCSTGSNF